MKHTTLVRLLIFFIAFIGVFANVSNAGACWWAFYQVPVPKKLMK